MNSLIKTGIGVSALAGVGGAGYGVYDAFLKSTETPTEKITTTTIRSTFGAAIINLESEIDLVKAKLKKLKDAKDVGDRHIFKAAQDAEKQATDRGLEAFKEACQQIYNKDFESRESETFRNFKNYCARTIKDKMSGDQWATNDAKWQDRLNKLKTNNSSPKSQALKGLIAKSDTNEEKLKEWCTNIADAVFEGDNNLEFKDAKTICGKSD